MGEEASAILCSTKSCAPLTPNLSSAERAASRRARTTRRSESSAFWASVFCVVLDPMDRDVCNLLEPIDSAVAFRTEPNGAWWLRQRLAASPIAVVAYRL